MTKRKFSAGWYAGSVREGKRGAWLAGSEAALDTAMKTMDQQVKAAIRKEPMPDSVKAAFLDLQMAISTKLYEAIIAKCMVKTPFDPPLADQELLGVEREPDTAARENYIELGRHGQTK